VKCKEDGLTSQLLHAAGCCPARSRRWCLTGRHASFCSKTMPSEPSTALLAWHVAVATAQQTWQQERKDHRHQACSTTPSPPSTQKATAEEVNLAPRVPFQTLGILAGMVGCVKAHEASSSTPFLNLRGC
jgi:hypothetical protein